MTSDIQNKLSNAEILIAEDSPTQAEKLRYLLEEDGYSVIAVSNGKQALAEARRRKPTLIVSDVMMPEMDGYETTQRIRREHKNSTLPIIAVTAKAMKGDRQKCIEAGASDYITKPVKIDQLLSLMRLWFFK